MSTSISSPSSKILLSPSNVNNTKNSLLSPSKATKFGVSTLLNNSITDYHNTLKENNLNNLHSPSSLSSPTSHKLSFEPIALSNSIFLPPATTSNESIVWNHIALNLKKEPNDGVSDLSDNINNDITNEVRSLNEISVNKNDQARIAERLVKFKESLRSRHEEAREQFLLLKKTIHKELEQEVSVLSNSLKERLSRSDNDINETIRNLNDNKLIQMDIQRIDQQERLILHMFDKRNELISHLSDAFDAVEQKRAKLIDKELKRLVNRMTEIAYMLQPDIERFCQNECNEVNQTILSNRTAYAELISKLRIASVQRLDKIRSIFEERKLAWRHLRHTRAINEFQTAIKEPAFVSPPERRDIFEELKKVQNLVYTQACNKMEYLGTLKVPSLKPINVAKINRHLVELRTSLDEIADRALNYLSEHQDKLQNDAMELVSELRSQLQECAAVNDDEIAALIEKDCIPQINEITSWISSLKTRLENVIMVEEQRIHHPALAFTGFYTHSAKKYEQFENAVNTLNETITERFNAFRDNYDDNIKALELKLENTLTAINQAPNLTELENLWNQAKELVGENSTIEQAHRNYNRDSVNIASSHASELEVLLLEHLNVFGNYFGFSTEDNGSGNTFTSTAGTIYYELQPLKTLAESLIKIPYVEKGEDEDKSPNIDFRTEHNTATIQEFDPIIDKDGELCYDNIEFKISIVIDSITALRLSFVDQWETFGKKAQSDAVIQAGVRQTDLAKEINQLLRVHRPRIRRVESENFEKRAVELAQNKSKFDRFLIRLNQLITANQASFVAAMSDAEQVIEEYVQSSAKYAASTKDASIGMTSLQAIQKKLKEKNSITAVELDEMQQKLSKISSELTQKSTMAENSFIDSCKLIKDFAKDKPQPVISSLSKTKTKIILAAEDPVIIEQPGTYHPVEVEFYKNEAINATKAVHVILSERKAQLDQLNSNIDAMLNLKTFDDNFHSAIEDLSMNQGLGHIYGAPKMKATIHLREEFILSDASYNKIKSSYETLQSYLLPQVNFSKNSQDNSSLASNIIFCLDSIRADALNRGKYLSILIRNIPLPALITDLPNDLNSPLLNNPYVVEASQMLAETTSTTVVTDKKNPPKDIKKEIAASNNASKIVSFLERADSIQKVARSEMSVLYQNYWNTHSARLNQLGRIKPDFKNNDPDNCVVPAPFIERMAAEQLRAKQNYTNYINEFKSFLEILDSTLPSVPRVVFADVLNRTQTAAAQLTSILTKEFNASFQIFQEQQKKNKSLLKPSFASPDSKPALDSLCTQEKLRYQESCALITAFRKNLLEGQLTNAELFSKRVLFVSINLMNLFDTTVSTVDLNLPEVENEDKSKSLKRSMRQYMRGIAAEKDKETYDPRNRFLTKTWPGVPLIFELPIDALPVEEKVVSAPTIAPSINLKKDAKVPEKSVEIEVKKSRSCPPMTGFKIQANREIIEERNQSISAYSAFFNANVNEAISTTSLYLQDEENWNKNWASMVEKLTSP